MDLRRTRSRHSTDSRRGLKRLDAIHRLETQWGLRVGAPFEDGGTGSLVAPAVRHDGTRVVLKIGSPHMEAVHEADGLRFWDGDPTVRLLEVDTDLHAMLLERCEPGMPLRCLPDPEQDAVIAAALHRLWRAPVAPHPFRPLAVMLAAWADEARAAAPTTADAGLVAAGLRLFDELSRPSADDVLLATDLHAGNVLSAGRRPWLVIDPKPFVGDRAYDVTQHLLNCRERLLRDPDGTIGRVTDLAGVDRGRVRLWTFARAAAAPGDAWDGDMPAIARVLA